MTWIHVLAGLLLIAGSAGVLAYLRLVDTLADTAKSTPSAARTPSSKRAAADPPYYRKAA